MKNELASTETIQTQYTQLKQKYQDVKIKERYLRVINEFATSLMVQNTVNEIVWDIAKNAVARLGFEDCVVYLLDEAGEYLIQCAAHGPKNPIKLDILNPIRIKIGNGIVGTVAKTGIAEIIHDTRLDARYIIDDASRLSEITVPITTDTRKVIGIIDSEHPAPGFYKQADLEALKTIASIAASRLLQAFAQEELKRSNEALKQFAYIASHDLQEPLRMVGSYAQLLDKRYRSVLDNEGLLFLNFLTDGAKRMNLLIEDLLSFSRLDATETELKKVDCNEVLESVLYNLRLTLDDNDARVECSTLPEIRGHFSQMVQLFQNLISNAVKFRNEAPPRIHIEVESRLGDFLFSVSDNGIGLEPAFADKVFLIFKRLHSRSQYSGNGIGLSICKKIIENRNGKIWVESELGKGSTFYFTIPK